MMIDIGVNLTASAFNKDRTQVIQRALDAGVSQMVVTGTDLHHSHLAAELAAQYPGVLYATAGVHPHHAKDCTDQTLQQLETLTQQPGVVAIGECGLDFYLKHLDQSKQLRIFEAQLDLAKKHNLPVVVHSRKATEQVIQCIKPRKGIKGMIHSYSGSYEQAMQLVKLGFSLSFGGAVTYSGASRLREMVRKLPLEAILIETDAPDQPDQKHHGLRNEPGYITQVVEQISQLKNISIKQLIDTTTQNAQQLFSI